MDKQQLIRFFQQRDRLIDDLEAGVLNKSAFLEAQYESVHGSGMKPSNRPIRSLMEGLYNYQYYNTLAKWERVQARICEFRDPAQARQHRIRMDKHYDSKDRETRRILEFYGLQGVEAFYIRVPSPRLEGQLLEIVLVNEHRVILHTADEGIRHWLQRDGVVKPGLQPSRIEAYVQSDYD